MLKERPNMAQCENKRRHAIAVITYHRDLCGNHSLQSAQTWYEKTPGVLEKENSRVLRDAVIDYHHPNTHPETIVNVKKDEKINNCSD